MTDYNKMFSLGPRVRDDLIIINKKDIIDVHHSEDFRYTPRGIMHNIFCTEYVAIKSDSRIGRVIQEELDGLHAHWIPKAELGIKKVLYSAPATIVFWTDGTKTVVKCAEGDEYTPEVGLAMAISKKVLGDRYSNVFRKYCVSDAKEYDIEVNVDEDNHTVVKDL